MKPHESSEQNIDKEWFFSLYPECIFPVEGQSEKLALGLIEDVITITDFIDVCMSGGKYLNIQYYNYDLYFMFCDDNAKKDLYVSDTSGNVVYQGALRNKTHEEILTLVKEIVELLIDTEELEYEEKEASGVIINFEKKSFGIAMFPEWEAGHPYCYYDVYLKKQKPKSSIQLENITFHIVNS